MARIPSEAETRREIVEIGRRLYAKNLIAAGDGNISVRVGRGRLLVTASGAHKGFLGPEDVVAVDLEGRSRERGRRPSSELLMHTLCYAERPDCNAIVHAHPPIAVALALAGVSLSECFLSEACLTLGPVPTAPYSTPTTDEVPRVLREHVRHANAVIMDHHGALCLGSTLDEAWRRMETLEHTARILHAARLLGPIEPLPAAEVGKLKELAHRLGMTQPADPQVTGEPSSPSAPPSEDPQIERIVAAVTARLRGALSGR